MKKIIKVFPDNMSSGLWADGVNISEHEVRLSKSCILALRYWHEMWEFAIDKGNMSDSYKMRWNEDGKRLVEAMNECQSEYEFVYVESV